MKKFALFYDYLNEKNVFELTYVGTSHYTFERLSAYGRGAIMVSKKEEIIWLSNYEVALELLEK